MPTTPETPTEPDNTDVVPTTPEAETTTPESGQPSEETYVEDVGYAVPREDIMSEESKQLIKNEVSYDSSGYSMIEDRYVIAADSSLGKVGDVVRFTNDNGQTTECVIGVNTRTSDNKNKIHFLIDENRTSATPLEISNSLISSKVENIGNYKNFTTPIASGNVQSYDSDEIKGDDSDG